MFESPARKEQQTTRKIPARLGHHSVVKAPPYQLLSTPATTLWPRKQDFVPTRSFAPLEATASVVFNIFALNERTGPPSVLRRQLVLVNAKPGTCVRETRRPQRRHRVRLEATALVAYSTSVLKERLGPQPLSLRKLALANAKTDMTALEALRLPHRHCVPLDRIHGMAACVYHATLATGVMSPFAV